MTTRYPALTACKPFLSAAAVGSIRRPTDGRVAGVRDWTGPIPAARFAPALEA